MYMQQLASKNFVTGSMNMLRFCFSSSVSTGGSERGHFRILKLKVELCIYLQGREIVQQFPFFRGMYSSQMIRYPENDNVMTMT